MVYQQIEYQVRASLGRNEWVILIYYPDNAGGKSTNSKFTGTKEQAAGAARHKIDNWLKEQKRKALLVVSRIGGSAHRPSRFVWFR